MAEVVGVALTLVFLSPTDSLLVAVPHAAAEELPSFVAADAGIGFVGQSFGVSWGDFNEDNWPDLFVGNHMLSPTIYVNQSDGTFQDVSATLDLLPTGDFHGAAWADFDNDGDQDLVQLAGAVMGTGEGANALYVNEDSDMIDQAGALGVANTLARGRTPLWLDANGDGELDLLTTAQRRADGLADPATLFIQDGGVFAEAVSVGPGSAAPILATNTTLYGQLADVDGDHVIDAWLHGHSFPQSILRVGRLPIQKIDVELPPASGNTVDAALADLNGDLLVDIVVTGVDNHSDFAVRSDDEFVVSFLALGVEHGLSFTTSGQVSFELRELFHKLDTAQIFIGADGTQPAGNIFTLDAGDPSVHGIKSHLPGLDEGVFIGFDPATATWQLLCSGPVRCVVDAIVTSTSEITNHTALGFDPDGDPDPPTLFIQNSSGFDDATNSAGLGAPSDCSSVIAADLDNDTDIDLYFVCSGRAENEPNLLYANNGSGSFVLVPDAGGATGSTQGKGDSVAFADYDLDGYLDLFVTNGKGPPPLSFGPNQLFNNLGSGSHWLQLTLVGDQSNTDGVGAVVLLSAGGMQQVRYQDGGVHARSQNHQRLHFGLGASEVVDRIVIHWPSGNVQVLENVNADQIMTIVEEHSTVSRP